MFNKMISRKISERTGKKGIYQFNCTLPINHKFNPQPHQIEVVNAFLDSKEKGMILFHKLGSGKTCTSIMIADALLKTERIRSVYILTPGSLRKGWVDEYCTVCGANRYLLKRYFTFITYNYRVSENLPNFNNSLVIIDEVHNLINGVKNRSTTATAIYEALMGANRNCRILLLSGTPIYNQIEEWALINNLLKPGSYDVELDEGRIFTKVTPNDYKQVRGVVSFYAGAGSENYPDIIKEEPIAVNMSSNQERAYDYQFKIGQIFRSNSMTEQYIDKLIKRGKTFEEIEIMEKMAIVARKYIFSRSESNFTYPKEKYRSDKKKEKPKIESESKTEMETENFNEDNFLTFFNISETENERPRVAMLRYRVYPDFLTKYGGWISEKTIAGIENYSPKFSTIIANIQRYSNQKHVVFSFFKSRAGVYLLHSITKIYGIRSLVFSGDLTDPQRREILHVFNSPKNRYGELFPILFITEAGAEGITVKEARHIHIVESSPRETIIQQAIGRIARYKSHAELPKEEQNIRIWRYWSIAGNNYGYSIDYILYQKGQETMRQIEEFTKFLRENSVTGYDKKIFPDDEDEDEDEKYFPETPMITARGSTINNLPPLSIHDRKNLADLISKIKSGEIPIESLPDEEEKELEKKISDFPKPPKSPSLLSYLPSKPSSPSSPLSPLELSEEDEEDEEDEEETPLTEQEQEEVDRIFKMLKKKV